MTVGSGVARLVMQGRPTRAFPEELRQPTGLSMANLFPFLQLTGGRTAAGVRVDEDVAMCVSAVYRAVWVISSVLATLPQRVYRTDAAGEKVDVGGRPEYAFLRRPNPEVNRFVFWSTVIGHEVLTGNAFVYVVTDDRGRPLELWPVEPKRVQVGRDGKTGRKVYVIDGTIPQVDYLAGGNIVHFTGLTTDGMRGVSPIQKGAEAMGLSVASEQYAGRFFSNSSDPRGYLSTDQDLTAEQMKDFSEAWEFHHRGTVNANRVGVLNKGVKWSMTDLNPQDSQLLETRKFQVTDIERWFGVPPHLMFDVEKTTSWGSGIAEQGLAFVTYTLNAHIVPLEQTVEDELLPSGVGFDFLPAGLMRGKLTDQVAAASVLIRVGFEPQASLQAVGLEGIGHTGAVPVGGSGSSMPAEGIPTPAEIA